MSYWEKKIDIRAYNSWDEALAILGHELRKNPPEGPRRKLRLELSKGVRHEDYWTASGEHSSQDVTMFFIQEVDK